MRKLIKLIKLLEKVKFDEEPNYDLISKELKNIDTPNVSIVEKVKIQANVLTINVPLKLEILGQQFRAFKDLTKYVDQVISNLN